MTRATSQQLGGQNVCAFLDMLAISEGTPGLGDDGYNVIVGGTLFNNGYTKHPEQPIWLPRYQIYSTAAGRYQFIKATWRGLAQKLHFSGFTPIEQDLGAVELIRGRGALEDVIAGRFDIAIRKCAKEWASLPGAGYGQRENALAKLQNIYTAAGGRYA